MLVIPQSPQFLNFAQFPLLHHSIYIAMTESLWPTPQSPQFLNFAQFPLLHLFYSHYPIIDKLFHLFYIDKSFPK